MSPFAALSFVDKASNGPSRHYECFHCGRNLTHTHEECPTCGGPVSVYEFD